LEARDEEVVRLRAQLKAALQEQEVQSNKVDEEIVNKLKS
jgi:hypothetical protein